MTQISSTDNLKQYFVWDRNVRLFHWINAICVIGLIGVGLVILNNKALGVSGDGKILLKTVHVYIGYVFALNLIWRFIWAFIGSRFSKWRSFIPFTREHRSSFKVFIDGVKNKDHAFFMGHNPLARLMVALLLLLLTTQAVTGLVLAGTDIYFPPFGQEIKEWIAEDKSKITDIKPGSKNNINEKSYKEMRDFRKPFITTHQYIFYTLLGAILLHIIGVVVSELKEKTGLVSAMITGIKVSSKRPVDEE